MGADMRSDQKHPTEYPGVRYREHPTRKHGIHLDRYFMIRYQKDGKRMEEGLGWASGHVDKNTAGRNSYGISQELQSLGGMSAKKAFNILCALKNEAQQGKDARIRDLRDEKQKRAEEKEIKEARINAATVSFSDFFNDHYFPEERRLEKPNQYMREEPLFRLWISPVIGGLTLQEISDEHINKIKVAMQKKGRAPRTILYAIAVIRQVFNRAKKKKLGHGKGRFFEGVNPVFDVEKPKLKNERTAFFTKAQAIELLDALKAKSELCYNIALVSLDAGLRAGEVFALEWEDINLDFNFIHVKDPKNGCPRNSPMTKRLIELFSSWIPGTPTENVFQTRDQKAISRVSNTFKRTITELGFNDGIENRLKKYTFHTLRHTYASWLVLSGANLFDVQKLMGHKTMEMTQRYAHLSPKHLSKTVALLEEYQAHKDNILTAVNPKTGITF